MLAMIEIFNEIPELHFFLRFIRTYVHKNTTPLKKRNVKLQFGYRKKKRWILFNLFIICGQDSKTKECLFLLFKVIL
jgi:hypothetical protein